MPDKLLQDMIALAGTYLPKVALAILTLIVGLWIIKSIVRLLDRSLEKKDLEVSLRSFFVSLGSVLLKVMLVLSIASMVGVETTSFIAVLGAAGFAIGLALQGSLSNFAGGVLILLFKPFKVGDFIEAQGFSAVVRDIQIFHTILKTGDNKTVILANGPLAGGSIVNYSTEPQRRVDMVFGIGYGDDIEKAKQIIQGLIDKHELILKEPESLIVVSELADSSVNITVRVWCNSGDYWAIYFGMQERVKLTFDAEGINIPYPQQDVHLHKVE